MVISCVYEEDMESVADVAKLVFQFAVLAITRSHKTEELGQFVKHLLHPLTIKRPMLKDRLISSYKWIELGAAFLEFSAVETPS